MIMIMCQRMMTEHIDLSFRDTRIGDQGNVWSVVMVKQHSKRSPWWDDVRFEGGTVCNDSEWPTSSHASAFLIHTNVRIHEKHRYYVIMIDWFCTLLEVFAAPR